MRSNTANPSVQRVVVVGEGTTSDSVEVVTGTEDVLGEVCEDGVELVVDESESSGFRYQNS